MPHTCPPSCRDPRRHHVGVRRSGIGRQSGLEAFYGYFDIKAVMVNTANQAFYWFDMSQSDARLN